MLLASSLDRPRTWLHAHPEAKPEPGQLHAFRSLIDRRRAGTPIAHLTGQREFWSLPLRITPATLIPRPETELLVDWALEILGSTRAPGVLELGTGSGAIALALASERADARLTATDLSPEALDVARRNAGNMGCKTIEWLQGDWFAAVPAGRRFELIVSNPPYVAAGDPHLAQGDLRYEPPLALVAGPDGLREIARIVAQAARWLTPGGWLLLEHGFDQGEATRDALLAAGFADIVTRRDLGDRERISGGRILP